TLSFTLIERWNGANWSIVPSPNVGTQSNYLQGIAGSAANDLWAVGYYQTGGQFRTLMEHWDGTAWTVVPSPNPGGNDNRLFGVVALSAGDAWAAGYYSGGLPATLTERYTDPCLTATPVN